jgi:hypothetical protein
MYDAKLPLLLVLGFWLAAPLGAAEVPAKETPAKLPGGLLNDWLREQSPGFEKWDIGGEARLRYEIRSNAGFVANRDFGQNLDNSNDYLLLREKVHVGYRPADWVLVYGEARDSVAVDDDRRPSPENDFLDLHQAYALFGNAKDFPLLVKVGRQEMIYGDERFVGVSDWSNTGRSFDAVKFRYENEKFWVDAFTGRVVVPYDEHFNVANDYDWFSGLYASTREGLPWQESQAFAFSRNAGSGVTDAIALGVPGSPSGPRDVYTFGARVKSLPGKLAGWDYSAEIAGQFGSVVSGGVRRDLEAMTGDATGGYTWAEAPWSPRLGVGYTYASGDRNPNDDKAETFEPLFGTNHKFYGFMDLWGPRNIHSGRFSASCKPVKGLVLSADYHLVWLADTHDSFYPESGAGRAGNGYGRNPGFSSFVGSEINAVASYTPAPWADLQLGYGHFFTGDYIEESITSVAANGGVTDADWFYTQVKLRF